MYMNLETCYLENKIIILIFYQNMVYFLAYRYRYWIFTRHLLLLRLLRMYIFVNFNRLRISVSLLRWDILIVHRDDVGHRNELYVSLDFCILGKCYGAIVVLMLKIFICILIFDKNAPRGVNIVIRSCLL